MFYLLKMLPPIILLAILGNTLAGCLFKTFMASFHLRASWLGVGVGLVIGLMGGVSVATIGDTSELPFAVSYSVACGVMGGVLVGVKSVATGNLPASLIGGAAVGLAVGVVIGALISLGANRKYGAKFGLAFAIASGAAFSVASIWGGGVTGGIAFGIAFGCAISFALDSSGGAAINAVVCVLLGLMSGVSGAITMNRATGLAIGLSMVLAGLLMFFRLATFPFDIAVCVAAYIVGRMHSASLAPAWYWCPVTWNESMWVPLPFAGRLLALLVQRDKEKGFGHITFVTTERPRQRRVAVDALVRVANQDLKASSVAEVAEVAARLNWITAVPRELHDEFLSVLLPFDRASQHIHQFLVLNNQYLKYDALRRAVREVSLNWYRIVGEHPFARGFLRTADDWHALLLVEERARPKATRNIPNPFVFSTPVVETKSNIFAGRRDIIRLIESSVLGAVQMPTLLLHGSRRMGKTSILNQLPRLLGPDFAPAVVDCQNPAVTESQAGLLRYVSAALSDGLRRQRIVIAPLAQSVLASGLFGAFDDWLDRMEQVMPERMRAVLCLDEYEHLRRTLEEGWGAAMLDAMRHMLQHRRRIVLMFTGAHTFQELGPAWTDRFNSARRIRVSFLTRGEVVPLLTQPTPEFDMSYAPGALEAILNAARGQPFLTQAVAFELVQLLNEQHRRKATLDDVEKAIARALVSGGEYFANVWNDAGEESQAIMRALAKNDLPPNVPEGRTWLLEHDVLNAAGEYNVPMVERWMRENT